MTPAHIQLDVRRVLAALSPHALWRWIVRYRGIAAMVVGWFALVVVASGLASLAALWLTGFLR